MQYIFEWDLEKAQTNLRKHSVSFESATTIFKDSKVMTIFDEEHSEEEERWISLGLDQTGSLIVVCHTFQEESDKTCRIRIFSTRKATRKEQNVYRE